MKNTKLRHLILLSLAVAVLSGACTSVEKTPPAHWEMMQRADRPEVAAYNDEERFRQLLVEHPELVNRIENYSGRCYKTVLQAAAMTGQVEKVKALLAAGAQVNLRVDGGFTPLMFAAWYGHTEVVRILLNAGAEPDASSDRKGPPTQYVLKEGEWPLADESTVGMTALHFAAGRGHAEIVSLLGRGGASLNLVPEKDSIAYSPLELAVLSKSPSTVKALLAAGANPNVEIPLYLAVRLQQPELVRLLLAGGAVPDGAKKDTPPPLVLAASENSLGLVRQLLAAGADVNAANPADGGTAWHYAHIYGHKAVAKVLLAAGASTEWPEKGAKLLYIASKLGRIDIVKELLAHGADVNAKLPETEETPLMVAALKGQVEVAKLLLSVGANPRAESADGHTALHAAAHQGHSEIVKMLLAAGADVNADNAPDDYTPLLYASRAGRSEVVKLLLAAGADIEAELDKDGQTPLWLAALNDHADTIRVLMTAGADSTHPCTWLKTTPLMVAAHQAKPAAVKALLECGADVNLMNVRSYWRGTPDQSALSLACDWGSGGAREQHVEIVKLLLAAGANTVLPPERTDVDDQPVYGAFINGHTTGDLTLLRMLLEAGGSRGIEAPLREKVQKVWEESPFRGQAEEMILQYTKP